METIDFQNSFLYKILGLYPKKSSAIDDMGGVLSLSKDAIYRRLRGDSVLTPTEMARLAVRYNISLDDLVHQSENRVFFDFNAFNRKIDNVEDYIDDLLLGLKRLTSLPKIHLYYPTCEIPIFYYCYFPELFFFKLYVWGRTIWQMDYLMKVPFNANLFSVFVREKTLATINEYIKIPSTELWSLNIFDNTLNQVEYHAESGYFEKKEDALELCDMLKKIAKHMESMAERGEKQDLDGNKIGATFTLFQNEMIYTNNMVLVKSDKYSAVHSSFCNPNFITSADSKLFIYTEKWFKSIIAKSTPIGTMDEKNRSKFFSKIIQKIDRAKLRIESFSQETI